MDTITSMLTVFYDSPFWVAMYERICDGEYRVSRIVFGAEPKDYEVYEYMLRNFSKLRFSSKQSTTAFVERKINPKRMQREIKKQLQNQGSGTKSMQAIKLMREQDKLDRKANNRIRKEEQKCRQFDLRMKKKKEKHKGH